MRKRSADRQTRFAGQICSNFWLERNGQVVLSEWRVALLEAVADTGSISAAAARQGVHFRVAWRKLQEMEARLGTKLTERTTGGFVANFAQEGMQGQQPLSVERLSG
jgi:molybdenum-dependent DNA-binding transcriptional regulator ModE